MSEMTSLRQWLAFSVNYLQPRYYRVPRYFSTVLTVAQNQWYRATLRYTSLTSAERPQRISSIHVDVDVEWMYELRQSPLCPPQTYNLHSNDTTKFLVYYSTALRLPVPSNCALKS